MVTNYTPDYLSKLREAVVQFETAFEEWMQTQTETDPYFMPGLAERTFTKQGVDPAEAQRREMAVAEAAGLASKAVAVTGAHMMVQGFRGPLDPIANWQNMTRPKAWLTPRELRAACATIKGRLDSLALDAEAENQGDLPAFSPAAFHPLIWNAAAPTWTIHQYRVAVREAAEHLNAHWKQKLGRTNVQDTEFWGRALASEPPKPGEPRLRWPGSDADNTVKSMREGLMGLAKGLNLAVRNIATHDLTEISEQEGMERLAAYSHLARLLDQCEILRHPEDLA